MFTFATMEKIRFDLLHMPRPKQGLTLALGEFDGLHVGHQQLLLQTAYEASQDSAVLLFACHYPGKSKGVLSSLENKLSLLSSSKLDYVYVLEENESIYGLSPIEFIERVLLPLGTATVVVGEDYRFGKGGKGDLSLLAKYFRIIVVPFTMRKKKKVSSSRIKELIAMGDLEEAKTMLGHPYSLRGKTVRGNHIGHTIGFPTLNMSLDVDYVLPPCGVYFALAYFKGRFYKSICNIGYKPTVGGNEISIEAYLFDYQGLGDYGFTLQLDLLAFHRPEVKFGSLDELKSQIEKDKAWALSLTLD